VITFHTYQPEDLPELTAVWNDAFSGGPNSTSLTERDFIDRVTAQPSFDPAALLVAVDAGRAVGFVHFGPLTNSWYSLPERRPDPSQGQIWALVAPPTDRGLTQALLDAAVARLVSGGAKRIIFHPSWVQGSQPFYNGIAGAYEIPGLSESRAELREALSENGFEPIAHYATPEFDLSDYARLSSLRQEADRIWQRIRGAGLRTTVREVRSAFFPPRRVVDVVWGLDTIAITAFGLWEEYAREFKRRLYGVTGVQVAKGWRGIGLGKLVMVLAMEAAAREGAETIHLHVYQNNEPAWNLYHRALGFQPKYTWITLAKHV
jgi:ribosomal protein S18 acetylase RimI-like enzyme